MLQYFDKYIFFNNMLSWFKEKGTKQGIFYAILIYLTGALNDVAARYLGERLHFVEVAFFRFSISTVLVFFPMLIFGKKFFKTNMHKQHLGRGVIGSIALALCCLSVGIMPLAENTTILFCEAFFMLPLAAICLKEKISKRSIIATIFGFIGLVIMFKPNASNININAVVPAIAAMLFAISNIIIKRMVDKKENTLTMLFYFGLYSSLVMLVFLPFVWKAPNVKEMFFIFMLGLGANLIQLFIFLAYRATTASNINPIRYTELPFAMIFGYSFFGQIPELITLLGSTFIIIGTLITIKSDKQNEK
ncbi:MAG: DMT family transporter [Alphaproteobacteria bacterium]|nr:DMT family transporter [Alphaproteobacteria bacterium]